MDEAAAAVCEVTGAGEAGQLTGGTRRHVHSHILHRLVNNQIIRQTDK